MSADTRVRVGTPAAYDVVIGRGLAPQLPSLLGDARRVALVHPASLAATAAAYRETVAGAGYEPHTIEVPDAEGAKSVDVAAVCWSALGRCGFTRSDVIVGVGGGSTTDLAGFVAATWLRGVRLVQVPTTLLGMVDAAVGGKTGVNTAEGKNLVGAFHEPHGVLCDLDALETLPRAELVSGLAEIVKCGFVADPHILDLLERDPAGATDPGSPLLRELVVRAVRVKADVVAGDLRETGGGRRGVGREVLNYGHTLGHAVESVERYTFRHGEAVAIGMCYAAELARLAATLDEATADRHGRVLALVGLPTMYRRGLWDPLLSAMRLDKKSRGDSLRFVVLEGLAQPVILTDPDPALLTAAYAAIAR